MNSPRLKGLRCDEPLVLVVDDDSFYREILRRALSTECAVSASLGAADVASALAILEEHAARISLVIADYKFEPGAPDGLGLLRTVGERWPHVRRMMLTGYLTGQLVISVDPGVRVLDKDFHLRVITDTIRQVLRR